MKVNTILTILCAVLFYMGFALAANANTDTDGDGVLDAVDNCPTTPNGPLASTLSCNNQEDNDGDGFGNACDGDLDQDGTVLGSDWTLYFQLWGQVGSAADLDCDGTVLGTDWSRLWSLFGTNPG